jgi:hypothetical protein
MKNLHFLVLLTIPFFLSAQVSTRAGTTTADSDIPHLVSGLPHASGSAHLARSGFQIEEPLLLSSFVAKTHHVSVLLSWVVSRQQNSATFIVERALGNSAWEKVGVVKARAGQREYSFWDVRVLPGASYQYRLVNQAGGNLIQSSKPVLLEVDTCIDEYLLILGITGFIGYLAYQARQVIS